MEPIMAFPRLQSLLIALSASMLSANAIAENVEVEKRVQAINDSNTRIGMKIQACSELAQFGKDAVPALRKLLESRDANVSRVAQRFLATIGADAMPELKDMLHSGNSTAKMNARNILMEMGGPGKAALAEAASDADPEVRKIGLAAGQGSVAACVSAIDDKDTSLCFPAATRLCTLATDSADAVAALDKALSHVSPEKRKIVLRAMAPLAFSAEAPAALRSRFFAAADDPDSTVRQYFVDALMSATFQMKAVADFFPKLLHSEDAQVRSAVIRTYRGHEAEAYQALPVLKALARDDSNADVRAAAAHIVEQTNLWAKHTPTTLPTIADPAIEAQIQKLSVALKQVDDLKQLAQSCETARRMGKDAKSVAPLLVPLTANNDKEVARTSFLALFAMNEESLSALIDGLRSDNPGVIEKSATLIGMIQGSVRSAEPFVKAAHDNNVNVREQAVKYLPMYEPGVSGPPLVEALGDADARVKRVALEGLAYGRNPPPDNDATANALIGLLQDPDPKLRLIAAAALSRFPAGKTALPQLEKMATEDKDESARLEAKDTIHKLSKLR